MRRLALLAFALALATCGGTSNPDNPSLGACSDGVDNDGDGQVDFPDDLGCTSIDDASEDSPTSPKCSDGRDNDGDGAVDFPDDPGCFLANDDDEVDDCPDGPNCPQCSNGQDDDMNGATDYPDDSGCASASDDDELIDNPAACGPGLEIRELPPNGIDTGMLDGSSTSQVMSPCGGGMMSSAIAYVFQLTQPKVFIASTEGSGTTVDTVLDIRSANCVDPASELACSDDVDTDDTASSVSESLPAGLYYLIVSGHDPTSTGAYGLTVQMFTGEGAACADASECGPGLVCRTPVGGTAQVCAKPVCSDGQDDDDDAKADFPDDPGCSSPDDSDEADDCPDGPNCPECGNGDDDDGDGKTDYPDDLQCPAASTFSENFCPADPDFAGTISAPTTDGTLAGKADNHDQSCQSLTGNDVVFALELPVPVATLRIDTAGSSINDTVLSIHDAECSMELECDDDGNSGTGELLSLIELSNVAAGTYAIQVDSFGSSNNGAFKLNVKGTVAPQTACTSDLFTAGVLVCPQGTSCTGGTCQ